ncbi:MAG: Sir2 family NAD-dependent protein deacetylase [Pseudomonadota bacterium]
MKDAIAALAARIDQAQSMVCFTGAGISTESGIPDFRSPGTGLWSRMRPIPFREFLTSPQRRRESWQRRFQGDRQMDQAEPNRGHRVIARWIREGRCDSVITQNVDGLHQASGIPVDKVVELHGNATYAHCLDCGNRVELTELEAQFAAQGDVEACGHCGGIIKTATISFGQPMPEQPMRRAQQLTATCDLFLVAGSSLSVYPAAAFPEEAGRGGARLAIINREATHLDGAADLVVHGELGDVLEAVAAQLG